MPRWPEPAPWLGISGKTYHHLVTFGAVDVYSVEFTDDMPERKHRQFLFRWGKTRQWHWITKYAGDNIIASLMRARHVAPEDVDAVRALMRMERSHGA